MGIRGSAHGRCAAGATPGGVLLGFYPAHRAALLDPSAARRSCSGTRQPVECAIVQGLAWMLVCMPVQHQFKR